MQQLRAVRCSAWSSQTCNEGISYERLATTCLTHRLTAVRSPEGYFDILFRFSHMWFVNFGNGAAIVLPAQRWAPKPPPLGSLAWSVGPAWAGHVAGGTWSYFCSGPCSTSNKKQTWHTLTKTSSEMKNERPRWGRMWMWRLTDCPTEEGEIRRPRHQGSSCPFRDRALSGSKLYGFRMRDRDRERERESEKHTHRGREHFAADLSCALCEVQCCCCCPIESEAL